MLAGVAGFAFTPNETVAKTYTFTVPPDRGAHCDTGQSVAGNSVGRPGTDQLLTQAGRAGAAPIAAAALTAMRLRLAATALALGGATGMERRPRSSLASEPLVAQVISPLPGLAAGSPSVGAAAAAVSTAGAAASAAAAVVLPGQQMIRLSGSDAGGAACLDGSDYAFYIVPGSTAAFSIAVHGGGWCADEVECLERSKIALGSSRSWNLTECYGAPGFNCYGMKNCTMVFMPYCDGSSFTGHRDGTWPVPNSTKRLTFRGARNFQATIDTLIRDWGLGNADEVILSGGSAGGLSTFLKLDYLAERVPKATVVGMPVAGYFADLGEAPFAAPKAFYYPDFPDYTPPYNTSAFRGYM